MNNEKGFTLIELLISFTIFTVVILIVGLLFGTGIKVYLRGQNISGVLVQGTGSVFGQGAAKGMLWEVRLSSAVTATEPDRLNLNFVNGSQVLYYRQGNNLMRVENLQEKKVAEQVERLEFKYYRLTFFKILLLSNGLLEPTTRYDQVDLVNVLLEIKKGRQSVVFCSNAKLRNR